MSDENNDNNENTPTLTLTDSDHQSIADKLFEKAEQRQQSGGDGGDGGESSSRELKLTDEDRKGIAAHLRQLDKEEAEDNENKKKEKARQKQEQEENIPQAPTNIFERSLFAIGGGKRAAS